MRHQVAIAAALLALAGTTATSAFAGDYEAFDQAPATSVAPKSRDQVFAELQAARKNGQMKVFSSFYNGVNDFKAVKSRDEVKAELAQAQASGEYELINDEVASFVPAPHAYGRTLHAAK